MVANNVDDQAKIPQKNLAARIRHACAYPFARPACSYLFVDGAMAPLSHHHITGRIPILASGSNASPERLATKFGGAHGVIPVTAAVLFDFAVVFAGHFTSYGAIPATLTPHRGARTRIWITWLTHGQLDIMHQSEGVVGCQEIQQRYDYRELDHLDLRTNNAGVVAKAGAYLSRRMLAPCGKPLRFAEVRTENCALEAYPEQAALRVAHQRLGPGISFPAFMANVLRSPEDRQMLFQALTPHTVARETAPTS